MNDLTIPEVRTFQEELLDYTRRKNPDLLKLIREKRKLEPEIEKGMADLVGGYVQDIIGRRTGAATDQFDDYVDEPSTAKK